MNVIVIAALFHRLVLADISIAQTTGEFDFQRTCMMNMLGYADLDDIWKETMRRRFKISSELCICKWDGVDCNEQNIVTKIYWKSHYFQVLKVSWLPPTLIVVDFSHSPIFAELDTRCLPRDLEVCNMSSCDLKGTINLCTLPSPLKKIDVSMNRITGQVDLTSLPKNLVSLQIVFNDIHEVLVDTFLLPEHFKINTMAISQDMMLIDMNERENIKRQGVKGKKKPNTKVQ